MKKAALIILFLFTLAVAQDRQRQPVPTYTLEVRALGSASFRVWVEGEAGGGQVRRHLAHLPLSFYADANQPLMLKIQSEDGKSMFEAVLFYEHEDTLQWLSTMKGSKATINAPAR